MGRERHVRVLVIETIEGQRSRRSTPKGSREYEVLIKTLSASGKKSGAQRGQAPSKRT